MPGPVCACWEWILSEDTKAIPLRPRFFSATSTGITSRAGRFSCLLSYGETTSDCTVRRRLTTACRRCSKGSSSIPISRCRSNTWVRTLNLSTWKRAVHLPRTSKSAIFALTTRTGCFPTGLRNRGRFLSTPAIPNTTGISSTGCSVPPTRNSSTGLPTPTFWFTTASILLKSMTRRKPGGTPLPRRALK